MEKLIRVADPKKGIVQITTVSERWYAMPSEDPETQLPVYKYVPSVTWICDYYPKGVGFYKWLANTGWDEAQSLKEATGNKGSKVHQAIAFLLEGGEIPMDAKFLNDEGKDEPLTLEEYEAILSFVAWFKAEKPEVVAREMVVWNNELNYAGTVDLVCRIGEELWVVDFKTSQAVWPSHILQVSAYKHARAGWESAKLAVLQIGYRKNRAGYKWNEVTDQMDLFLAARSIWAQETEGQSPKQKDYPVRVSLGLEKKVVDSMPGQANGQEPPAKESPKTKEVSHGAAV